MNVQSAQEVVQCQSLNRNAILKLNHKGKACLYYHSIDKGNGQSVYDSVRRGVPVREDTAYPEPTAY